MITFICHVLINYLLMTVRTVLYKRIIIKNHHNKGHQSQGRIQEFLGGRAISYQYELINKQKKKKKRFSLRQTSKIYLYICISRFAGGGGGGGTCPFCPLTPWIRQCNLMTCMLCLPKRKWYTVELDVSLRIICRWCFWSSAAVSSLYVFRRHMIYPFGSVLSKKRQHVIEITIHKTGDFRNMYKI